MAKFTAFDAKKLCKLYKHACKKRDEEKKNKAEVRCFPFKIYPSGCRKEGISINKIVQSPFSDQNYYL